MKKLSINISVFALLKIFIKVLILCNSYFLQSIIIAQYTYKIEQLTSNEGLSHNCVRCIIQDSKGFIWIGTEGGLNKFDGYNITEYVNNPDDPNTISNNWISTIYEDPADSGKILWFGTKGGLNKFNRETEQFTSYNINTLDSANTSQDWVHCIYKVNDEIYLIGGNGLKSFEKGTGKFQSYLSKLEKLYVYLIYKDSMGDLWIGSNLGLFQLNHKFEKKDKNYQSIIPNSLQVLSFYEEKNGKLWIGTDSGLYIYLKNERKIIRPEFKFGNSQHEIIYSIFEDSKSNLLATSNNGLIIINPHRDSLNIYQQLLDELQSPYTRGNNRPYNQIVISAFIDKTDIIWIGTCCNGVYTFIPDRKKFELSRYNPNDKYSLGSSWVTSFCEDKDGKTYVGTIGGHLNQFDINTERFLQIDLSVDAYSLVEGLKNDIWYSNYYSLINFDFDDMISTAYFGQGISNTLKYTISQNNDENEALRQHLWDSLFVNFDPQIAEFPTIDYLYIDKTGILWCVLVLDNGKSKILHTFNQATKKFYPYEIFTSELISNSITNIYEDKKGILWFGTERKGLIKRDDTFQNHDDEKYSFIQYTNNKKNINSISNNTIFAITEDDNGIFWIGTNNGLNKFKPKDEIFTRYGVKEGLPSESITGILVDDEGNLWVSTNKGLSKFDPQLEKFKNFNVQDGLQSNNFSVSSNYMGKNGDMYFGGPNGFNLLHPKDIEENPFPPKVVINGFTLFNEPVTPRKDSPLKKTIEFSNEIVLDYDQDIFTFEFVALDFTNPRKNIYAYKMEGVNPDWIYTDASRRFATYTKLHPGEYTFRVKASNNDAIWNEEGSSINIIILPPWWRTNLAYIAYALLIIGMFIGFWRFQTNSMKLKHQVEIEHMHAEKYNEINKIKSRFFTNISHAFRTPLTLVLGLIEKTLSKTNDRESKNDLLVVQKSAKRLNKLINQLLDLAKMEANSMKLRTSKQNIIPFIKGLVLSFTSFAAKKRITLKFNSSSDLILVYFDEEFISKIINNLLSNACKFTLDNGCVEVNVKNSGDPRVLDDSFKTIEISVSDTGIGIPSDELDKIFDRFYHVDGSDTRERKGVGIGLSITKELVEIHHGEITVTSEVDKGSSFVVSLPLGKEHLNVNEIIEEEKTDTREVFDEMLITKSHIINKDRNNYHMFQDDKPILLIVEDNNDMRNYIKEYVDEDYNVIEAANGKEGEDLAFKFMPDMIISDIMMPQMDGFQLCDKLKSDERTSHIPIILLTAKATNEDKLEGLEKGADAYMMKPFDIKELLLRSKTLVEQRKKIREHFINEGFFNCNNKNISSIDKTFLKKVVKIIEDHLPDNNFSIDILADGLAVSRSQLHRKLISLIGESPSKLIQRIRLDRAVELIEQNFGNISEIALEVGFLNPGYFSKCFYNQFGKNPSEY